MAPGPGPAQESNAPRVDMSDVGAEGEDGKRGGKKRTIHTRVSEQKKQNLS